MKIMGLAAIAGVALSAGVASAQQKAVDFHGVQRVFRIMPTSVNGRPVQVRPVDAETIVYQNSDEALFYAGIGECLDDARFTGVPANLYPGDPALGNTGPGAGGGFRAGGLLTGFALQASNAGVPDMTMTIKFWNRCELLGVTSPVNSELMGTVVLEFTGIPAGFPGDAFIMDAPVDIFPANINFTDDEWGFEVTVTNETIYDILWAASSATGLPVPQGPRVGGSADVFFLDADLNGMYDYYEDYWFGGFPNYANMYLRVDGCLADSCGSGNPCDCVDFNNDTEIDFSDVEGFIAAYNLQVPGSCKPGADFNGDTEFDFSDIEQFLAKYTPCAG